jgi:superfamily I DNA/RNA helicase
VARTFDLVEHFRRELESRRERGADPDGGGPFQVLDALALLAEMHPDPVAYLAAWDHLLADEERHSGTSDDTLEREEAEDRVIIGTIHAAKGREYHAVVIPDYDCDVSRWEAAQVEEERRVVYVGVTRARDSVLFTVDTSVLYVQPFLRELVETPGTHELASLTAWLDEEDDPDLRRRIGGRVNEIEVLFPELVEVAAADAQAQ